MGYSILSRYHPERFAQYAGPTIDILRQLNAAQLVHSDLKATNFLVAADAVLLIDYDSVRQGESASDTTRFLANWDYDAQLRARWQHLLTEADL